MFKPREEDKNNIALVVVGYNRLREIQRLLESLQNAHYDTDNGPLVISIDASGCEDLYSFVRAFEWTHGNKYVNIQEKRLGLKEHIFQCGDLTEFFKGVVILEDDLYVSPYYYHFVETALAYYQNDESVAGISLYSPSSNSIAQLPFIALQNGASVYAYQDVATWGELFNHRMWSGFRSWLNNWDQDFSKIDMPEVIKTWSKAWSKFYYAYMISTGKFFVFPHVSLTTNFNDTLGEHGSGGNPWTQSSLLMGQTEYLYSPSNKLVRYDVYSQNVFLYDCLGCKKEELTLDLYGMQNQSLFLKKYLLTTSVLPYKIVKSFSLTMRPIELNVINDIEGKGIFLYDTSVKLNVKSDYSPYQFITYMLQGFKPKLVYIYAKTFVLNYYKRKFRRH